MIALKCNKKLAYCICPNSDSEQSKIIMGTLQCWRNMMILNILQAAYQQERSLKDKYVAHFSLLIITKIRKTIKFNQIADMGSPHDQVVGEKLVNGILGLSNTLSRHLEMLADGRNSF